MFSRHDRPDDELDALLRSASPSPPALDPETADSILRTVMRDFRRARPGGVGWRLFAWGAAASLALGAATAPALVRPGAQSSSSEPGHWAALPTEPPRVVSRALKERPHPRRPVRVETVAPRRDAWRLVRTVPERRRHARQNPAMVLAPRGPSVASTAAAPPASSAEAAPSDLALAKADLALAQQVEEARRQQALALAPRLLVIAVPPIDGEGANEASQGCDPSYARAASVQTDPFGGITRTEVTVTPEQPEPEVNRVALRPWWSMSW